MIWPCASWEIHTAFFKRAGVAPLRSKQSEHFPSRLWRGGQSQESHTAHGSTWHWYVCLRGGWNRDSRKEKGEEERRICSLPVGTPGLMGFLKNLFFLSAIVMGGTIKAIPSGSIFIACHWRKQISAAENSDIQSLGPISSGMWVQGHNFLARTESLEMVFSWEVLSSYLPLKRRQGPLRWLRSRRLSYEGWILLPGFTNSREIGHFASPHSLLFKRTWTLEGLGSVKASTFSV